MAPNPTPIERRSDNKELDCRASFADFAATMCADLAQMARHQGLDTLGYLLEMAQLEAENLNRPPGGAH